jgi:hypothetical protein
MLLPLLSAALLLASTTTTITASWIDPATPASSLTTYLSEAKQWHEPPKQHNKNRHHDKTTTSPTSVPTFEPTPTPTDEGDKKVYSLVMSDEFEVAGRTFNDGHDPMWTSLDKK